MQEFHYHKCYSCHATIEKATTECGYHPYDHYDFLCEKCYKWDGEMTYCSECHRMTFTRKLESVSYCEDCGKERGK